MRDDGDGYWFNLVFGLGIVLSLVLTGVVIWAIIKIVTHYT